MAASKSGAPKGNKKIIKKVSYAYLQKLAAAVCLLAFVVMLAAGLLAGVSVITITYRACIVMVAVKVIARILVSVLTNYEEIDSGKA
jgi:hypothetical protein